MRPGEKIHECLINETEMFRTTKRYIKETHKTFYILQSSLDPNPKSEEDLGKSEYSSANTTDWAFLKLIVDNILLSSINK